MSDQLEQSRLPGEPGPSDLDKVVNSLKAHPLLYAGAVLAVIAVGFGATLYSSSAQARSENAATELVRAVRTDDRVARIPALDAIVDAGGPLTAEALYIKAETAFRSEDYAAAEAAFAQVVSDYPKFQFAPDAMEGLGYVEEQKGNYEAAVVHYLDVQVKYPDTYAARRQNYNLGRAYAAQDKVEEAIGAYRRQVGEFADSVIASRATHELHKYQITHPDIYKQFEQQFDPETTDGETPGIDLFVVPGDTPLTIEEAEAEGNRIEEERLRKKREYEEGGTSPAEGSADAPVESPAEAPEQP